MHNLLNLFKFILRHPLNKKQPFNAIVRFLKWQIQCIFNKHPVIWPFTNRTFLIISKGMSGATGNLYCGLHEFEDMSFLMHFLRKDDVFADIGANIGSYTILAAGHVGSKTYAFEPVPTTFSNLQRNVRLNNICNVTALNCGIGSKEEYIFFTTNGDTVNHVAITSDTHTVEVKVFTLDQILADDCPSLIKIDVEGFETEVLKGALSVLTNHNLKAIIIELNGIGTRYGYDEYEIHKKLLSVGFSPISYKPFEREIIEENSFGSFNTIYVRDLDFVRKRIHDAEIIDVQGQFF